MTRKIKMLTPWQTAKTGKSTDLHVANVLTGPEWLKYKVGKPQDLHSNVLMLVLLLTVGRLMS